MYLGCSKDKPQTSNSLDDKNPPSTTESQMQSSSDAESEWPIIDGRSG